MDKFLKIDKSLFKELETKTAVFYSILKDWEGYLFSKSSIEKEDFFFLSMKDIEDRYNLSYREQKKCIEELTQKGLIEVKRCGLPPKMNFKIAKKVPLNEIDPILTKAQDSSLQKRKIVLSESARLILTKAQDSSLQKRKIVLSESARTLYENNKSELLTKTKTKTTTSSSEADEHGNEEQKQKQKRFLILGFEQTVGELKNEQICKEIFVNAVIDKMMIEGIDTEFTTEAKRTVYNLLITESMQMAELKGKFPRKYMESTTHLVNYLKNKVKNDFNSLVKMIERYG